MIINHNMMAMNTHRQMSITNGNSSKSIEKLSSGMRINRAGDDAAGLSISEKMRAQIRGLNQSSRNAQDGISLIQTAEGALAETQSILQRMRELAVQSASDTNVGVDRGEIQKEINQLSSEINRIGNTTEFNTMKLLNGDRDIESHVETEAAVTQTIAKTGDNIVTAAVGVTIGDTAPANIKDSTGNAGIKVADDADEAFKWSNIDTSKANSITVEKTDDGDIKVTMAGQDMDGNKLSVTDGYATKDADGNYEYNAHGVDFKISKEDYKTMESGANGKVTINMSTRANALSGGSVKTKDYTTPLAVGVAYSNATASKQPMFEKMDGTDNAIVLDNTDSDFDWSSIDDGTNAQSSITITKVADNAKGFKVEIVHADGTEATKVSKSDDEYGTFDADNGYYSYENHGVKFKVSAEELNKMDDGDTVTIDADAIAKAAGGNNATGDIGMKTAWTGLKDSHDDDSVKNPLTGNVEVDGTKIHKDAASVKIDLAGLDAGDATSKVTVTVKDAGGNVLIKDEIAVWDALKADGDSWTYDNNGVKFTLEQDEDADSHVIKAGSTTINLGRNGANSTGSVTTKNEWQSNISLTGGTSDAAITGNKISVDSTKIDAAARKVVVTGSDLQTGGTAKMIVDIQDEKGTSLAKDEFTFADIADAKAFSYDNHGIKFDLTHKDAVSFSFTEELKTEVQTLKEEKKTTVIDKDDSLNFQVGANQNQSMNLGIEDMRSKSLSVTNAATDENGTDVELSDGKTVKAYFTESKVVTDGTTSTTEEYALDVSSFEKAGAAVTVVNDAITKVSAERSKLGALQNRLEHTIKNLDTSSENLQASESRIRDVDMAKEMMEFQKNNILQQAAQAMLAQANQAPQGVLQLLR